MNPLPITTVRELVAHLGGPKAAGDLLDASPQLIVAWRKFNRLPAHRFLTHQRILAEHGIHLPPSIWGMQETADAA